MKNLKLLKEIFLFSLPIITGQIGQMLFGVGDIIVAGHFSTSAVSAIGVAAAIFSPFLMIGIGILLCIGPLASEIKGQGRKDPSLLFNSIVVAIISSVVVILALLFLVFHINWLKLNSEIEASVALYLRWTILSILPALIFQAMKEYLQGEGKIIIPNAIIILFNLINIILCYIFLFGWGPIPSLGIFGAALVASFCRIMMALILFFYIKKGNCSYLIRNIPAVC